MAEPAPRKSYLIVVLVVLAVLVVVIAKTATKHKTGPQSQAAQAPAEHPVAKIAAAVPADSTKIGVPEPAADPAPAIEPETSAKPAPPSDPAPAADPKLEPPTEPDAEPPAAEEPAAPQEPATKEVDLIPGSKLAECLKNGRPTLVDFGAGWCKPCQLQDPVLRQTAAKYEGTVDVVFVDTDAYPEIARQYRVSAIPAQFVFDTKGAQVATHIGFWPATEIDQALATAGVEK